MAAYDPNKPIAYFDAQRTRISDDQNTQSQQDQDAIKRRFAALGSLNSGSYIKQQQVTSDNAMARRAQALQGVDATEAQQRMALEEAQNQRDFQSAEGAKTRDFQSAEGAKTREFTAAEGVRNREYGSVEADKQRGFVSSQADTQRDFQKQLADVDQAFKEKVFAFDSASKLKQLDLADQEFSRDTNTLEFNKAIAAAQVGDDDAVTRWLNYINSKNGNNSALPSKPQASNGGNLSAATNYYGQPTDKNNDGYTISK